MAIEEPSFKLLDKGGSFELRDYDAYVVADTRVEADFERAGNIAFQRLFRYISGNTVARRRDPRPLQSSLHTLVPAPQRSADAGCTVRQTRTPPSGTAGPPQATPEKPSEASASVKPDASRRSLRLP